MHLPDNLKRVLWMSSTFLIVFTFMGLFVNLYIWQAHHSIAELCWYNIVNFAAWGVAFTLGAASLTKFTSRFPMRLAALSSMAAFALLLFVHVQNPYVFCTIVGIPAGLFGGFYYSGQNLSIGRLGQGEEFAAFYFYQGLITQVIGLVNPIVFALVIHWFGYVSSFALMFVFGCVMFGISFTVPKVTFKDFLRPGETYFTHSSWRHVFPKPSLRWMHAGLLAGGLFFQFQAALSLMLTFSVTGSKILIGLLSMGYTLACVVALRLHQRIRLSKRTWLNIGVLLIVVGFLFAAVPNTLTRIVSNFLTTVGMFYFGSVWNGEQYAIFSKLPPLQMARLFAWRENTFNVARFIVYASLIPLHQFTGTPYFVILAGILICSVFVPLLQQKALTLHAAEEHDVRQHATQQPILP